MYGKRPDSSDAGAQQMNYHRPWDISTLPHQQTDLRMPPMSQAGGAASRMTRNVAVVSTREFLEKGYRDLPETCLLVVDGVVHSGEGAENVFGISCPWTPLYQRRTVKAAPTIPPMQQQAPSSELGASSTEAKFISACQVPLLRWYNRERKIFSETVLLRTLTEFCDSPIDAEWLFRARKASLMAGGTMRRSISRTSERTYEPSEKSRSDYGGYGSMSHRNGSFADQDFNRETRSGLRKSENSGVAGGSASGGHRRSTSAVSESRQAENGRSSSRPRNGDINDRGSFAPLDQSPIANQTRGRNPNTRESEASSPRPTASSSRKKHESSSVSPETKCSASPNSRAETATCGNEHKSTLPQGVKDCRAFKLTSLNEDGERQERDVFYFKLAELDDNSVAYIADVMTATECKQLTNFVEKAYEPFSLGTVSQCGLSRSPQHDLNGVILISKSAPDRELANYVPEQSKTAVEKYTANIIRIFESVLRPVVTRKSGSEESVLTCVSAFVESVDPRVVFTWALHGPENSNKYLHIGCPISCDENECAQLQVSQSGTSGASIAFSPRLGTALVHGGKGALVQKLLKPFGAGGSRTTVKILRISFLINDC